MVLLQTIQEMVVTGKENG